MKTNVLDYFKNLPKRKEDQFNAASQLYRKCPGKSLSQESFYNRAGYSPVNLQNLHYDLKKLVGVTDAQIRNHVHYATPVTESKPNQEKVVQITATTPEEVFTTAPDEIKETIKLRDEFPFLNSKDCPQEFYILVGQKFNHYDAYVAAHAQLLEYVTQDAEGHDVLTKLSDEEVTELALAAVEDFKINQEIYDELIYYKEEGKILGNHPVFLERKFKESIDALTVETATKKISNLDNYIRRDKKKLEKAIKSKNEADITKFTDKVKNWNVELGLIKAKFGFANEK